MIHWASVFAAGGSMFLKDVLGTILTVAEAKGRAWLAAGLDVFMDLAAIVSYGLGAEAVIHGITPQTIATLTCMSTASFIGTGVATAFGRRMESIQATP